MNNFSDRLKIALKSKNISQAELARRTGIGRNSISDYINGKYEAKQDNIFLMANVLEVNEAWLMGMDSPMTRESHESTFLNDLDPKQIELIDIFQNLDTSKKDDVLDFARYKMHEQNKENFTIAAHSDDPNKRISQKEFIELNRYLDEADKKFDGK